MQTRNCHLPGREAGTRRTYHWCTHTPSALAPSKPASASRSLHTVAPVCLARPQRQHGTAGAGPNLRTKAAQGMAIGSSPLGPASDGDNNWLGMKKQELGNYMRMARLHNTLPALLLVFVGAWAGTGRDPAFLTKPIVWLMAMISAGVSAASMVINDYFDWASGTDVINAPDKPLPSGLVKPDMVVLIGGGMYVAILMAACVMENPAVRAIIAFSAGATLLYTPVFKRITMVKNALVASVIALAPISGALVAGASAQVLQRLSCATLFAFTAIMFREVLMDCSDEKGDREAGVMTLPVMIGAPAALLVATVLMLGGAGVAMASLLTSNISAASTTAAQAAGAAVAKHTLPTALAWPYLACVGLVGMCIVQLVVQVVSVFCSGFSHESLHLAVENCIKPMGLAIIMLAATA